MLSPMMKPFALAAFALLIALPAHAGQPEARAAALANNCPPKKIEVYQNQLGGEDKVVYMVTCTLPKVTDPDAPKDTPDALLVSCNHALCEVMRPVAPQTK